MDKIGLYVEPCGVVACTSGKAMRMRAVSGKTGIHFGIERMIGNARRKIWEYVDPCCDFNSFHRGVQLRFRIRKGGRFGKMMERYVVVPMEMVVEAYVQLKWDPEWKPLEQFYKVLRVLNQLCLLHVTLT